MANVFAAELKQPFLRLEELSVRVNVESNFFGLLKLHPLMPETVQALAKESFQSTHFGWGWLGVFKQLVEDFHLEANDLDAVADAVVEEVVKGNTALIMSLLEAYGEIQKYRSPQYTPFSGMHQNPVGWAGAALPQHLRPLYGHTNYVAPDFDSMINLLLDQCAATVSAFGERTFANEVEYIKQVISLRGLTPVRDELHLAALQRLRTRVAAPALRALCDEFSRRIDEIGPSTNTRLGIKANQLRSDYIASLDAFSNSNSLPALHTLSHRLSLIGTTDQLVANRISLYDAAFHTSNRELLESFGAIFGLIKVFDGKTMEDLQGLATLKLKVKQFTDLADKATNI